MYVYEIVSQVQQKFRGLCTRLAERNRKSKQYYQSHAVEPFTMNPESYGKPSEADRFVDFCEEYEAAMPGAGLMLSEGIAALIRSRLTKTNEEICQRSMRQDTLKEATEALIALDKCDFSEATIPQMKATIAEVQDMVNNGQITVGKLLSVTRQKEMERAATATVKKFERAA